MDLNYLNIIFCKNVKVLTRSWLFWLFFLFLLVYIPVIQIRNQVDLFTIHAPGFIGMASFIPYTNAYLFTLLQVIPLLLLSGTFLYKERKLDSMDVFYYRPASNAEHVWGMCLGFIGVFLGMGFVLLLVAGLLHFLAASAPFDIRIYLFYLFTLILPSTVFLTGFFVFITGIVRSRALSLILLFGCILVSVFYIGDAGQGIFDVLGITLPNVFSEITGHSGLMGYLLQRGCWLFLGLGFIQLAVVNFRRISNAPGDLKFYMGVAIGLLAVGILFFVAVFWVNHKRHSSRQLYSAVYLKYESTPKMTMLSQDIEYTQQGQRLTGKSRIFIRNQTHQVSDELILYLNPALEINAILCQEVVLPFEREHQVIRVQKSVLPEETLELEVNYEGGLDENICYLDIPENTMTDTKENCYITCRYGKRYLFLDDNFTLLIPEVLWYPVTVSPVNLEAHGELARDFARYTLRVSHPGEKTIISQGNKNIRGDTVKFDNDYPLPGISLCIGDYESRSITVDSTMYELNLFKGHGFLMAGQKILEDTLSSFIADLKSKAELRMGRRYPYRRFILTETPVTFASYFRNEQGGSGFAQPELLFVPERGVKVWRDYEKKFRNLTDKYSPEENKSIVFGDISRMLEIMLFNEDDGGSYFFRYKPLLLFQWNLGYDALARRYKSNNYSVLPLFYHQVTFVQSDSYPVLDVMIPLLLRGKTKMYFYGGDKVEDQARYYLTRHSLQEAISDDSLESNVLYKILALKSDELVDITEMAGISPDCLRSFLAACMEEYTFQSVTFSRLNEAFMQEFGLDFGEKLAGWYTGNQVPFYRFKYFSMEIIRVEDEVADEESRPKARVRFSLFNDGGKDGIVNVQWNSPDERGHGSDVIVSRGYEIKANTGIDVAFTLKYVPRDLTLDMNISGNLPRKFIHKSTSYTTIKDTSQYLRVVDRHFFIPSSDNIIVDNEDEGFKICQSSFRFLSRNRVKDPRYPWERMGLRVLTETINDVWEPYMNETAHGCPVRAAVYRIAGKGRSSVEWNTSLSRAGEYEVYVYIPLEPTLCCLDEETRDLRRKNQLRLIQSYTVSCAQWEKKIEVDIYRMNGWISLGSFDFEPGDCKVSLAEKGEPWQFIVGDAVKWVYREK